MSEVIFNGCAGRIEGRFHQSLKKTAPVALILSPHPKQGGTMNNRVTHSLFKTFAYKGFSVLKFNYRGVGYSEGVYDEGEGELSDAASALDWLQSILPMAERFWVAGYSFGALLSMQLLMRRPELEGFIAVSPPANHYDFNFLAPCPVSGKIIQGARDSYVKYQVVESLVEKLRAQTGIDIDYTLIPNAGHLYSQTLDQMC
ncbi:MAG: alpha/beta hydrolase, partial [Alphaproteobacteria bacterium]|nr:alpha/beta hydrolase [Alphaproteobacteria bacterium]